MAGRVRSMGAVEQDWESVLDARGGGGDGGEDARYDAEYAESDAGSSKSVVFVGGQGSTTGLSEFASLTSLRMSGLGVGAGDAALCTRSSAWRRLYNYETGGAAVQDPYGPHCHEVW